jgi:hypothetical protein
MKFRSKVGNMTRPVIFRYLRGMFGRITDPGAYEFVNKVKLIAPDVIDVGDSPYDDRDVPKIATDFTNAPADAIRIGGGSSLGANNIAAIGQYAPTVTFHGIWGFQASDDGLKAQLGTTYEGIAKTVLFAHEVYNPLWIQTAGLGHYEWVRAPGNTLTGLRTDKRYDFHPGETEEVQAMFLAEIGRVIAKPGD